MGSGGQGMSREAAASALAWWVDAGVDTLVDEAPRDWLAAPVRIERSDDPIVAAPPRQRRTSEKGPVAPAVEVPDLSKVPDLTALRAAAEAIRAKPIFADGDPASGVMIIGQDAAPDDDMTGRPFSGPSGALLDRMLKAIGRDRSSVYLTNLHLWRSVSRSVPTVDPAIGAAILKRHIELVRPKALLLMGQVPVEGLFGKIESITKIRGRWLSLELTDVTIPALPTLNPAYLLRAPANKAFAWMDLLLFQSRIDS